MKYLVLYDTKPEISQWCKDRADFDLKKADFSKTPMYTRSNGEVIFDIKWILPKVDPAKYDGVVAYVKGNRLKGVWGFHNKHKIGDKKFSILQVEHQNTYLQWKRKGIWWTMGKTRKKTEFYQPVTTFEHELMHSLDYLNSTSDQLHLYIKLKRFNEYKLKFPKLVREVKGNLPELEKKMKRFVEIMRLMDQPVRITESYRSNERQAELYAQGRTKPGPIVTYAKPGQSKHNQGKAFDIVFKEYGYNAPKHIWELAGNVGNYLGLDWGGRWLTFKDRPHFELRG